MFQNQLPHQQIGKLLTEVTDNMSNVAGILKENFSGWYLLLALLLFSILFAG